MAAVTEQSQVPEVQLAGDPDSLFDGPGRKALEEQVLPAFLPRQRWFAGKAKRLASVRLINRAALGNNGRATYVLLFEVRFADGSGDTYFLPVTLSAGAQAERALAESRPIVLARLHGPMGDAVLHDALVDEDFCQELLDAVGDRRTMRLERGTLRGKPTAAFEAVRGPRNEALTAVLGPATSSNSLVFFGRRILLKLFRRLEPGINPDFEIGRFLTEHAHFERTPRMAGALEFHRDDGEAVTVAIVQELVGNDGDGWKYTLEELGRYFDRAARQGSAPSEERSVLQLLDARPDAFVASILGSYLKDADCLGRRTAEMHLALASGTGEPDFSPQPASAADVAEMARDVEREGRKALATLGGTMDRLPQGVEAEARRFADLAKAAVERLHEGKSGIEPGPTRIRCHGDYHLGQVLRAGGDFFLLDFEGEPARPLEQRRSKSTPLRDVAGMLRSLDYAAYAGLFAFAEKRPVDAARMEGWADLWQRWNSAAFLRAYLATAKGAAFLPKEREQVERLLRLQILGKAFYELSYELNNRPDWVRIPLRGLLDLLQDRE